jgi:hypothetical protein
MAIDKAFKPMKVPEFKATKSGYEVRTEILGMAKDLVAQEFHYKWNGWEMSSTRDDKTGQLVSTVEMPSFPGIDKVLETAQKMYEFVNIDTSKK